MENWYGVFLPAGTPSAVRDKLEKALFAVDREADGQGSALSSNAACTARSATRLSRRDLRRNFAYWPDTIKKLGITGE